MSSYIEIKPKKRDKAAIYSYKILNWYVRKNRKAIEDIHRNIVFDWFLYGKFNFEEKDMIFKTGACWNCGRQCKDLFCNPKCENSYERKQRQKNGRWSGHSSYREKETGEFQGGIKHG